MPTAHITQWKHNRAFVASVDPEFPDWAVTATFYAALHAVNALLRHDNVSGIATHKDRNHTLTVTTRYSKICRLYLPLYGLCRTIRYMTDPVNWVPWEQIESQVLRRYLYPIEKSVMKLMGRDEDLAPVQLRQARACPHVEK